MIRLVILFVKYHLAVAVMKFIFADIVPADFKYFTLCNSLFRSCSLDKGLITKLNDAGFLSQRAMVEWQ
jgi:hypothetical protein